MIDKNENLLLLDSASLYFRAFFGVPDTMRAPDGFPTNAIRGFLDFISTLVDRHRPTQVAACWDVDWRPAWRVKLIPTYKSHRVAGGFDPDAPVVGGGDPALVPEEEAPDELSVQVPVIDKILRALGIPIAGAPECEADDVIGTLARRAGCPVAIVTGDRDLFQLIDDDDQIAVVYTAKGVGRAETLTDADVMQRYGVHADQYVDFATMRGDTSDGLPGVKGVGDKTAAALVASYGDLAGILTAAADPSSALATGVRTRLLAALEYLGRAVPVVAVRDNADVWLSTDDLSIPASPVDGDAWADLVERYDLGTSGDRIVASLARAAR
jgi:5'-3' exonuclease